LGRCYAFVPLLSLDHNQKDERVDEDKFQADADKLHNETFLNTNYDSFATYLISHPANQAHAAKTPSDLTWVLVMRMLRNIVAIEHRLHWRGIYECLQQILQYTRTRENFRALIRAEEEALLCNLGG
jgi:hypothetical protein